MRIPCTICGAMILPATAQHNDGLCGQCVRNPAMARTKVNRARIIEGYGTPTVEGIAKQLSELTAKSAKEAMDRFSDEGIYAFLLLADPLMESAVARVMTETWAAKLPVGARWGGSGWYENRYMLGEEEFEMISQWAYRLDLERLSDRGDIMTAAYLAALGNLRDSATFDDSTALLLLSSGMGDSEIYAIAEMLNSGIVLKVLANQLALDEENLRAMRQHYSHYRRRAEPSVAVERGKQFRLETNQTSPSADSRQ